MNAMNRHTCCLTALVVCVAVTSPAAAAEAQDLTSDKLPPRMPLDEFVKDPDLMKALVRGVRAMKARKPSDPLSWYYQAAIHGVPEDMVRVAAVKDPEVDSVDQKKYWNRCPHGGEASANFLPWHRAYTHYFERILRAHSGEPRFALPYWDYSKPENYKFPKEFGTRKLATAVDGDDTNPLWHDDRNVYFASWEHWSGDNLPYAQLTKEAVDWSPAEDSKVFFGMTETEGLGGAVADDNPQTRGLLESFPHDPVHRVTGIIVPDQIVVDPERPGEVIAKEGYSLGMSGPPTAGFDPIFCVHHSNIDRLWAKWSCMAGKEWGNLPSQEWFDERPWFFFDVKMEGGQLRAVEVNRARKTYFDYRALGISFKDEDLGKTPLALPGAPSPAAPAEPAPVLLARILSPVRVSGLRPERVDLAPVSNRLKAPFSALRARPVDAPRPQRVLMRINGVDLSNTSATGFDVHFTTGEKKVPKRTDTSFVGSIALFRHDGHGAAAGHGAHHGGGGNAAGESTGEVFDVTQALLASGQTDPTKMHVVVVPYSLISTVDGQKAVVENNGLRFQSIEFYSK